MEAADYQVWVSRAYGTVYPAYAKLSSGLVRLWVQPLDTVERKHPQHSTVPSYILVTLEIFGSFLKLGSRIGTPKY